MKQLFSVFLLFSVFAYGQDLTPPIFNGVEFSPSSAANGDVISVIVDALDDTSGIDRIQIDIRNPEGEQLTSAFSSLSNWTDLGNNRYSYDVTINEFAISGDWYVSAVYIYDIAGNKFSDSFTSTNSPYILSVTSTTPDVTPPIFNGVEFSPSSAANGDVISVIVDALDDTSGIDRIQIDIRNPEGEQLTSAFSSLSNWTDLGNNRYSYDVTINEFAISGDWYVSAVYIYDIAGNKFSDSFTSTNSLYILSVGETTSSTRDILLNGTVSAENNQIKNVADPTDSQDAATKSYVDSNVNSFSGSYNDLSDKPTSFSGDLSGNVTSNFLKLNPLTQAEIDNLIPEAGTIVFNADSEKFIGYNGSAGQELDQSQENQNQLFDNPNTAQSFTAGSSGSLSKIDVKLSNGMFGQPDDNVTLTLREGEGTDGNVLFSTGLSTSSSTAEWISVEIIGVEITQGSKYTIHLTSTSFMEEAFMWARDNTNPYSNGKSFYTNTAYTDYDLCFKTYISTTGWVDLN